MHQMALFGANVKVVLQRDAFAYQSLSYLFHCTFEDSNIKTRHLSIHNGYHHPLLPMAEEDDDREFTSLLLLKAVDFAAQKHQDQRRKDVKETPYINHPIRVARLLAEVGGINNTNVLMAALLHDTVEDTNATLEEIEREFGPHVAKLVAEVTDNKALPKLQRKKLQIERAAKASDGAQLIKLADKLDNLRDQRRSPPIGWDTARVLGYHLWSFKVVDAARGIDPCLEAALDQLYREPFIAGGRHFPGFHTLSEAEKTLILEQYYSSMAKE
jgi:hypothetical protein